MVSLCNVIFFFSKNIHHNLNFVSAHQGEAAVFKEIYEDVFARYCVDIALSGHVHACKPADQNLICDA